MPECLKLERLQKHRCIIYDVWTCSTSLEEKERFAIVGLKKIDFLHDFYGYVTVLKIL